MYTDSSASQINVQIFGVQISARRPETAAFASVEEQYRKAKARLSAAQQEKMEAAVEFMAARAALSRWMEEIWPG